MISFVPQSATEQHRTEDPRKRRHANNVCGKIGKNLIEKKNIKKLTRTFFIYSRYLIWNILIFVV